MGQFSLTKANIAQWRQPGPQGFWAWVKDIEPRILTKSGKYEVFAPTDKQKQAVGGILSSQSNISVVCWPRRHGKSTLFSLLILWQLFTKPNWTCGLLGSSEQHSRRTQYNLIQRITRNTPLLADALPESDCLRWHMTFKPLQSQIQLQMMNTAASFGDKLDSLWVSDLHSHADLSPFYQLQASLLDSADSRIWVDSNVDLTDGPVHSLEIESQTDPGIYFNRIAYQNLDEYEKAAPAWISRTRALRLVKTTLEADWRRDLCGLRSSAKNLLFPPEIIQKCLSSYRTPVAELEPLTQGRAYRVGGGLDRARSLFQSSTSDATIFTSVLKLASAEHGEPEFYVLSQSKVNPNTSRLIKKAILKDHQRYSFTNVALENFEVSDLSPWLSDMNVNYELVNPMAALQNQVFVELFRIAKEGRLRIPANLPELVAEMKIFTYKAGGGQKYSFSAAGSGHDDRIYSLAWAIHSLRSEVLDLYRLGNVQCISRSPHRNSCFLMGAQPGRILFCSEKCNPYHRVADMFRSFKTFQLDSELTLVEFYHSKVKRVGHRVRQAV